MAAQNKKMNITQKRKWLLVLRILVLTAAIFYLIFLIYNNYFINEKKFDLYFATSDAGQLKAESRSLDFDFDGDNGELYFKLLTELKQGPENKNLKKTIPVGTKLLDYSLKDKEITLNFNLALRNNHWGGSTGEILTVYSIVNTYTKLDEIDSVKIILEGQEVDSLVGHLDLSQPLMYNQKLTTGS